MNRNPNLSGSLMAVTSALCAVALMAGCMGYRLGTTLPPGIKTVHVPTFINKSGEPQIEVETTSAAIQEFQRDGTLRVAGEDQADSILNVTISELTLEPVRYDRDEAKTASEYRLTLKADIVFKRLDTGETLVSKSVYGEEDFIPAGSLGLAKTEAIPEAARDLAHDIVESVVEYW